MKHTLIIFGILFFSIYAFGEKGRVGNGGYARVCVDEKDKEKIVSVVPLDLYEYEQTTGDGGDIVEATSDKVYDRVVERLQNVNQKSAEEFKTKWVTLKQLILAEQANFQSHVNPKVPESKDALSLFLAGENCNYVQIFNFEDPAHVTINWLVYDKMSDTDKAILSVHEVIYWMGREHAKKLNSNFIRKFVARLVVREYDRAEILWYAEKLGLNK